MESELIIMQQNQLRAIVKTITSLKLQVTQLENLVRELRLKTIGGNNETKINRNN